MVMARMILKKKTQENLIIKISQKVKKNTFEVSSAICDHLSQVFNFVKLGNS